MESQSIQFVRYCKLAGIIAVLTSLTLLSMGIATLFLDDVTLPTWSILVVAGILVISLVFYIQGEYPLSATQKEALHDIERSPHIRRVKWLSIGWFAVSAILLIIGIVRQEPALYWVIIIGTVVWAVPVIMTYGRIPRVWNGLTILPTKSSYRVRRDSLRGQRQ